MPRRLPKRRDSLSERPSRTSRLVVGAGALAVSVTFLADRAAAQLAGGGVTDVSPNVTGTSLRDSVSSYLTGPSDTTAVRPWSFSGDVDVELGATDNPGGVSSRGGWQPAILVSPDFNLNGVTSRLNVALSYSPRFAIYPSDSSQTLVSQTFNGSVASVLVPDWLFLNLRGVSDIGSRFGNTSLLSNSFVSRDEAVQTTSLSASPYLQHTFGGYGTVTVGYTYAQTFQSGQNDYNTVYTAPFAAQTAGFGTTGNLQTNTEFASFTTGENLGRVQESISLSASQFSGSAYYRDASTSSVVDKLSYSVYRWLTVFGTVGYQQYRYPSVGYNLNEPTWTVGVTLTPNADSSVTVQYGQVAGENTILASGYLSPTPRTRVYGSYNVDIQTGLGTRQNLLANTSVGVGGLLIDNATGSPTLANTYLASQSPLSRVRSATIGGALLLDRDVLTLNAGYTEFDQLGASTSVLGVRTPSGTTTNQSYVSGNWQHELNPSNSLVSGVSYSVSDNGVYLGTSGAQDTVQAYTSLIHTFTDTLSGSVLINHSERFGNATRNLPAAFGGNASQSAFFVGLRKSF